MPASSTTNKSATALKTISEVAEVLELPQHVLRFWETKFPQIQPLKRRGGRRFYRPEDIALLETIRTLLHEKGYTIKGAQALLSKSGRPRLVASEVLSAAEAGAADGTVVPLNKRAKLESVRQELTEIKEILRQAG